MKHKLIKFTLGAVAALTLSQHAAAEQTIATGLGALSTGAKLDFRIVIPKFLLFRVGSLGGTVDEVTFTVPAANVGDGTDIAGTGGDLGAGAVTARVVSNGGQVTLLETNNSGGLGLRNGLLAIPYSEILEASSAGTLVSPNLSNAGGNSSLPALTAGNVTNRNATWTFTYDNTAVYEPGTYGTSLSGGRVTYTASVL